MMLIRSVDEFCSNDNINALGTTHGVLRIVGTMKCVTTMTESHRVINVLM